MKRYPLPFQLLLIVWWVICFLFVGFVLTSFLLLGGV